MRPRGHRDLQVFGEPGDAGRHHPQPERAWPAQVRDGAGQQIEPADNAGEKGAGRARIPAGIGQPEHHRAEKRARRGEHRDAIPVAGSVPVSGRARGRPAPASRRRGDGVGHRAAGSFSHGHRLRGEPPPRMIALDRAPTPRTHPTWPQNRSGRRSIISEAVTVGKGAAHSKEPASTKICLI